MYFRVWYSDNCQSVFVKKSSSFFIVSLSFFRIMSRTVKLYDELCLCTVKIRNIFAKNLLTRKANRISTQKIIPKVFFSLVIFFRSIFAVGTISLLCFLCITIPPSRFAANPQNSFHSFRGTPAACHLPLHKGGFFMFTYNSSIFLTSTALNKDIFSCKAKSRRVILSVAYAKSNCGAGSRARISSFPLVDPDATHRPTGSTAGGARAFLRSG